MEDSALVHPALRRRQHRLEGSAQSLLLERLAQHLLGELEEQ